jgi:DNA (cytosine-5)-methyltransferase 1
MSSVNYIDLFAGTGGLSEGFIKCGFHPIAHVEMDKDASDSIKTRLSYHFLNKNNKLPLYFSYLKKEINRNGLWKLIPEHILDSVICNEIKASTIENLFRTIDEIANSNKVDLIIGGPPCQAYSIVGRSRDGKGMRWDKRNFLFRYYAEFLTKYKPKVFVFENVLGLLSAGNRKYLKEMLKLFADIGYTTNVDVLSSEDYGVLQKRKRIIIIGIKGNNKFEFPRIDKTENKWEIKKDLFYDLPHLNPGQELDFVKYTKPKNYYLDFSEIRNGFDYAVQHITRKHNERDLEIYSIAIKKWINEKKRLKYTDIPSSLQTHKNKDAFLDRYKVVDPFGHSHTIVAHIAKDGHYYIYPDINQVRSISVREAARIQSFPDDYFFEGGRTAAFRQIGNAVPPLMAEKLAMAIKHFLF